jgi:hypothetical protein
MKRPPTEAAYAVALLSWSPRDLDPEALGLASLARSAASVHVLAICRKMSRSESVLACLAQATHSSAYCRYSSAVGME